MKDREKNADKCIKKKNKQSKIKEEETDKFEERVVTKGKTERNNENAVQKHHNKTHNELQ